MSTYQTGVAAEQQVAAYYIRHYDAVLRHQRYRTPYGEIDLILETAGKLYFVEVKARKSYTQAARSIRPAQMKRIGNAILQFGADFPALSRLAIQFDVALVMPNAHIEIIENIIMDDCTS